MLYVLILVVTDRIQRLGCALPSTCTVAAKPPCLNRMQSASKLLNSESHYVTTRVGAESWTEFDAEADVETHNISVAPHEDYRNCKTYSLPKNNSATHVHQKAIPSSICILYQKINSVTHVHQKVTLIVNHCWREIRGNTLRLTDSRVHFSKFWN